MDFRSCPACKASVLEDDVEDCPFCGASMSGKPTSAAAKKPASAPAKPAAGKPAAADKKSAPSVPVAGGAKPAGAGRPGARPTAPAKEEVEDPFEVDTSALRKAVKLSPKPTKTRTLEVICPMCDTPGYMLAAEAGKEVHCCNPDCLAPVFKTQKPKVEEAPKEEPKGNRLLLLGGGVAVIGIGAAVWFLVLAKPPEAPVVEQTPEVTAVTKEDLRQLTPEKNRVVVQQEAPPATVEEIRKKSLEMISERARQRDHNRSAEFGTQLAAEAFAQAGDLSKARDQIRRLQTSAAQVPYFQIQPLVEIGWQQLAGGQPAEAQQTAVTALSKTKNMPASVRTTHDAAISLAALLMAVDRQEDALQLIQQEQDRGPRGVLSALWRTAIEGRTFDLDEEARRPWHVAMPEPLRIAAVETLVARGQIDKALALAKSGEDVASQDACRAAWAGRLALLKPAEALARVTPVAEAAEVSPAGKCQLWTAVAAAALSRQDQAAAQPALAQATAALGTVKAIPARATPSKKEIYESEGKSHVGLPNPAPARSAVQAAASLGLLNIQAGQKEVGWPQLQQGLEFARGMFPSPAATQALLDDCQKQENSVRSELASVLKLGNDETKIRDAFNRYRRQCSHLDQVAKSRLALQAEWLRAAALDGALPDVTPYAIQRSRESDHNAREPYLDSPLSGLLSILASESGQSDLTEAIKAALGETSLNQNPVDAAYVRAQRLASEGKTKDSSDLLERLYRSDVSKKDPFRVDQAALRVAARVQKSQHLPETIAFLQNLFDPIIQEDAFLLLGGYSIGAGKSADLWKLTWDVRELEALEHAALYRGFIAGMQAPSPASAQPPMATTSAVVKP